MPIVTGDFVELKPNPDLLNPKFGSYKISFDKYLQRRQRLRCNGSFLTFYSYLSLWNVTIISFNLI
uniref:Uncharacterized protein n=1 Tax=Syphacia muris TaxID=451379 RepID=A0A0N5AX54_9BILA